MRRFYYWALIGAIGFVGGQGAIVMWPEWSPWIWWSIAFGLMPALALPTLWDKRKNIAVCIKRNKIISMIGVVVLVVIALGTAKLFDASVIRMPEQFAYSRLARPYLTLMNAEIVRNDRGIEQFALFVKNNSDLPAENVVGQLILIPNTSNIDEPPIMGDELTTSSMGPHGSARRQGMNVYLKPSTVSAFVVFQIKYIGPLSNKLYSERSYHKFLGWPAEDETFSRKLVGTTVDENDWIEEYAKKHEVPMF